MLIVGAFRSNEINEEHPLSELIREFRKEHSCGTCLLLPPLRRTETEKLVADMLDARLGDMAALCQYLYLKTSGNPFSLRQLLVLIHDEGLLYFSREGPRSDLASRIFRTEDVLQTYKKIKTLKRLVSLSSWHHAMGTDRS